MKRIVMVKGAVETLEYFSLQMMQAFQTFGCRVMVWDMKTPAASRTAFLDFYRPQETVFLTFNFIGMSGESQFMWDEESIWSRCQVPCLCIMVDHPMYYYEQLRGGTEQWRLICIDRDHVNFVREFYPQYTSVQFLPLAGTNPDSAAFEKLLPTALRPIDVLFAGNYVALKDLAVHTEHLEEEYRTFYFSVISDLIAHPKQPMEAAILRSLRREIPDISAEDTIACMYHMVFVDLYVRSYFRQKIICALAEAGIAVHVIGKDWEKAECKKPENLIMLGQRDSLFCLQSMRQSKISVNVMPWFKDGAHDRIFNAMLQGSAVVTDSSRYLDTFLQDGINCRLFSLERMQDIPEIVSDLLADPKQTEEIARTGYRTAECGHTWADNAAVLYNNNFFL